MTNYPLNDKVTLITGASSGLGEATATRFAKENAIVVVTARKKDQSAALVDHLKKQNLNVFFMKLDVTDENNWKEVIHAIEEKFHRLDILINNAGIGLTGSITDFSLENWRKVMSVNLESVFLGTKYAIPLMEKSDGGSIVNIASVDGAKGVPGASAYGASKAAIRAFTKSAALECAEAQNNIRVNVLSPGSFHSPMVEKSENWSQSIIEKGSIDAAKQTRVQFIPMRRLATYDEIVNGIIFLASDESSYMTGSELIIDGGVSAR